MNKSKFIFNDVAVAHEKGKAAKGTAKHIVFPSYKRAYGLGFAHDQNDSNIVTVEIAGVTQQILSVARKMGQISAIIKSNDSPAISFDNSNTIIGIIKSDELSNI